MAKIVEYRLRPVTRYVLTRHVQDDKEVGCETLGEFVNATLGAQALAAFQTSDEHARVLRDYVIVERSFDLQAKAGYAQTAKQAEQYMAKLSAEHGKEFRIYSRVASNQDEPRPFYD